MLYLAYGSNLTVARLEERLGPCRVAGRARLADFELRFHKRGRDGTGKCDIVASDAPGAVVHGAVYELDAGRKAMLDRIEGSGYSTLAVRVALDGADVEAFAYVARPEAIEVGLRPFRWYKALVVNGARHHRLPVAYVRALEAVEAVDDPDAERASRHQRLARGSSG